MEVSFGKEGQRGGHSMGGVGAGAGIVRILCQFLGNTLSQITSQRGC